jgi:GT2 family glycosyltransferase
VLEVVVVDDGSQDGTLELLHEAARTRPKLRPVWRTNGGTGMARATGAEAARGSLLLLLDDDTVPEPMLASRHAAVHAAEGTAGGLLVVGAMPTQPVSRRTVHSVTTDFYVRDYGICVRDWERDPDTVLQHLWAGHMSLRREDALRVGLGDPVTGREFFEDLELGLRMRAAGMKGVYAPHLVATHQHQRTLDGFLREAHSQGRAMLILHCRHPEAVPDPTPGLIAGRAPGPARWLVLAAGRGGRVAEVLTTALLRATVLAGRLRLWGLQALLATLLRRAGQAAGLARARSAG